MKTLHEWLAGSLEHGRALGRSPVHLRMTRCQALVYVQEPQLLPTSGLAHAQVKKLAAKIDTTSAPCG